MAKKTIGLDLKAPEGVCKDKHCAFHGNLTVRGRQFVCNVKKISSSKSAIVEWQRMWFVPKYQRYEKRRTKLSVHNPECVNAKKGDKVLISECRKISKTKNFIILERLKK